MAQGNIDLRQYAKAKSVYLWQIADAVGVSEPTITRRFRREMTPEKKKEIRGIIDRLATEGDHGENG